jgi:HD-like signal output (HDOD) protein
MTGASSLRPETLLQGVGALGSLPSTWLAVRDTVERPGATTDGIAVVVGRDPDLVVRVLRMANSAMYGLSRRVETIAQAVALLGTRQVCDLALACSVVERFQGVPAHLLDMGAFWRHAIATAIACRSIAARRGDANPERMFAIGLLHDVGRLVFALRMPEAMADCLARTRDGALTTGEAERAVFGFDHARMGEVLLETWRLPPTMARTVGNHHAMLTANGHGIESATVHVADLVGHALGYGPSTGGTLPGLVSAGWDLCGLAPEDLAGLAAEVDRAVDEVCSALMEPVA